MSLIRKSLLALGVVVALAVLAAAGAAYAFYHWANTPMTLARKEVDITVQPRSAARAVAQQLVDGGLPMRARWFEALVRIERLQTALKSGNYAFIDGVTPHQALLKVARGDVNQFAAAIIEGWSFKRMRAEIDGNANLTHTTVGMSDTDLMKAIGAGDVPPEGMFFPDTYLFPKGEPDVDVYRRAFDAAQRHLTEAWEHRAPDLPLHTPYEALTLASLVEKETGVSGERGQVAAVFVNRLRIGMPLQTDPSVIYGLTGTFGGHLTKKDLQTDTPYNTYTRRGLPPTPIALPGVAALTAATHPADTHALYFVARGDGTSIFSQSLDEHNRAVNEYQRSDQRKLSQDSHVAR